MEEKEQRGEKAREKIKERGREEGKNRKEVKCSSKSRLKSSFSKSFVFPMLTAWISKQELLTRKFINYNIDMDIIELKETKWKQQQTSSAPNFKIKKIHSFSPS